jgi:hypothetical protein
MIYISGTPNGRGYSSSSGLDRAVNKFYINIGNLNVNNGIQHSIAAERTGDIKVYNTTIDNRVGQINYTINLDNRKVEFISPYIKQAIFFQRLQSIKQQARNTTTQ